MNSKETAAAEVVQRPSSAHVDPPNTPAQPRILLIATTPDWALAARLAMQFAAAGCQVHAMCPAANLVCKTSAVSGVNRYDALAPLRSLKRAIKVTQYDLAVPCDDLAAAHLHSLFQTENKGSRASAGAALARRSVGNPEALALISRRSRLMEIARDEDLCVPKSAEIRTADELERWAAENGTPAVLKADGTGGGRGVKVIKKIKDARAAFRSLCKPRALRVLKRLLVNHDVAIIRPWILRQRSRLSVQTFIRGTDATISISCWNGAVLASIAFEVVKTARPNGPASVVKAIDNWQMCEAAARLTRRLELSGLFGLDFRIDADGCAHLIEMNPRATQSSHLNIGDNGDLVGSLVSACSGRTVPSAGQLPACSAVAFFPNEWQNDPRSTFLGSVYHDVPWSEPDLLRALVKKAPLADRYF